MADRLKNSESPARAKGFTLIELVGVMIVVGILAVVVLPRFFSRQTYDARTTYDTGLSMLRYAQKVAIAQHRQVYVVFNPNAISLCFDAGCSTSVLSPEGKPANFSLPAGISASVSRSIGGFYFNALGRPFDTANLEPNSSFVNTTITLSGGGSTRTMTVEAETGYVH
jgi:MSHA pilin protein MshC